MILASTPRTASPHHTKGYYRAAGTGWGRAHEANPVLLAYREHRRHIPVSLFIKGWWYPDVVLGWSGAGFARRHHAYRVLSRYLAVFCDEA